MKPISIVTIKEIKPLFKGSEAANSVELITIEEADFELVSQKGNYFVGNKAVYIQPDYCLPEIPLFESFIKPNGDYNKSMLGRIEGKPCRIRAKKFNLSLEPNGDVVYSNGILLPIGEVKDYLVNHLNISSDYDLDKAVEFLGIYKYVEPENPSKAHGLHVGRSKPFPENVYRTDEDNFLKVSSKLQFPVILVGTEKVDGSSITIGVTDKYPEGFICSRNLMKPLFINKVVSRRSKKWFEKLMFWKKVDLNIYEQVINDDDFVFYGKEYLARLLDKYNNIILRGELNGGKVKGSGNKNNPASKIETNIRFFGIDRFNDKAEPLYYNDFIKTATNLELPIVDILFVKEFNNKTDLINHCNSIFKERMIEGIVIRTLDSKFSAKVMNLEYDSKK